MRPGLAAACAALAAVAFAAAGCGSGLSLDPVAKAADRTAQQGGSHVALTVDIGLPNGKHASLDGSGVLDQTTGDADLTFDLSQLAPQLGGKRLEEVVKDHVVYVKLPVAALPGGKPWVKIDPRQFARRAGLKLPAANGSFDPSSFQASLQALGSAAHSQTVGKETVDGVETTHYRATVDIRKLLQQGSSTPKKTAALLRSSPFAKVRTEMFDVWVGSDDLIHKLSFALGPSAPVHVALAMTFSDFGTDVNVQAPPAGATTDAGALRKR
jgi:hypothetical protein